ncbi:MAG: hypothetical protein M1823_003881 [Watsoniomyces obsoletus]|nr:MAG: hypothetical protein M1823_003881 [Watsoniomyces obsoletus]
MSPSHKRYMKILHTAEQALTGHSVLQQRYNQLLDETRRSAITRRRRQQIDTSGAVLTAEILDDMDYQRWLYEEETSSSSGEEDDIGTTMEMAVLPGVRPEEAARLEAEGLRARCSFFHVSSGTTGQQQERGGRTATRSRARGGGGQSGSRGRGTGSTGRNSRSSGRRGGGGRGRGRGVAPV